MGVEGMTLRDYFAARAMSGILTTPTEGELDPTVLASMAYEYADAMLAERQKATERAELERAERRRQIHANEQVRQQAADAMKRGGGK